jgi:RNA polymerase sigma-70 factor (ECF subfamily)
MAELGDGSAEFERQRARLMGVAYRILGSVADSEDAVQEAWIRWHSTDRSQVDNAAAFLTTVVTRLALDRLRRAKSRREAYTGTWLPEPIATENDPATSVELADSMSMALLVVLETLSPLERAAFVLREVFQLPYAEVAATLGREEAAVRQLVHRARGRVNERRPRFQADRVKHRETVEAFVTACASADFEGLVAILAPDVVVISDSGGVATAPRRPVHGADKVARLMLGIAAKATPDMAYGFEVFNGQLGLVLRQEGRPMSALSFTVTDGVVQTVHVVVNPAKLIGLERLTPRLSC